MQPTLGAWKHLSRYPRNRPSSKETLPWPWGCRDCHKSSRGTQRSCSACPCSQSWGQWKRSPGPWSHSGIPLLTYKHTADIRGERNPPHSVKEVRRYHISITTFTIKDPTNTWWVGSTGIWQSRRVTSWVKLLKVSNVAEQYKLGKEDLASVKKLSAVGSPSVARLKVLSQARVPGAQYSKPHESQPGDHSADLKTMTEPECPLTPPQDTGSVQTGTPASDWITSAKPNASDARQNN